MNKEDILRKARSDNERYEMEQRAAAEGSKLAFNVGAAVCLILMPVKLVTGHNWQDVLGLLGIMACVPHFYCWKKLSKKEELLNGIIWLAFGLFFTGSYLINVLYY